MVTNPDVVGALAAGIVLGTVVTLLAEWWPYRKRNRKGNGNDLGD